MISLETFRQQSLSFPEVTEELHFDIIYFRVNKKIFATYDVAHHRAYIKMYVIDQDVFSVMHKSTFFPLDNKWGKKLGWTYVNLRKADKRLFTEALTAAYCHIAPKKLADQVRIPDL